MSRSARRPPLFEGRCLVINAATDRCISNHLVFFRKLALVLLTAGPFQLFSCKQNGTVSTLSECDPMSHALGDDVH